MAQYTTTVVIYIIGLLALVLMIVYFWNQYKAVQAQIKANKQDRLMAPCPDYWENVGDNKCHNVFKLGNSGMENQGILCKIQVAEVIPTLSAGWKLHPSLTRIVEHEFIPNSTYFTNGEQIINSKTT